VGVGPEVEQQEYAHRNDAGQRVQLSPHEGTAVLG
jgi:hypothetical protein